MAGGFGWDGNQGPEGTLSSAELFDPTSNSFSTTGSMAAINVVVCQPRPTKYIPSFVANELRGPKVPVDESYISAFVK